jgi:hypothetical protein
MDELRESSLLFSLKQLFETEEERVRRERRLKEQHLAEEAAERLENARRQQEAEARRRVEEARLTALEAQRQREEEVRLEAVRSAELERVRSEIARKIEVEAATRQEEHTRRMALVREAGFDKERRLLAAGVLVSAALVIGSFSVYFGKLKPDHQRLLVQYEAVVGAERAQLSEARRQLVELRRQRATLEQELGDAKNALIASETSSREIRESPGTRRAGRASSRPRPARTSSGASAGTPMDPHDPMNEAL